MQKICILGLGLMGSRVARRLSKNGHNVVAWNRTTGPDLNELAKIITIAPTPCEAVKEASVVLMLLHDAKAVVDVILSSGASECIKPDTILADMGTSTPSDARSLASKLPDHIRFVDAPVSGGTKGAEQGTLSIFLGAKENDLSVAKSALDLVGRVTHMGDIGSGQAAKLANQIIVACSIAGLAEGIAYGEALGVEPERLISAMAGGLADSEILKTMGSRIIEGDFSPRGRAATHLKDLDCAFSQVEGVEKKLLATATAKKYLQELVDSGQELDHSAMVIAAREALSIKAK